MLKPKYELEQKVWAVTIKSETIVINVDCDLCNSTGIVEIKGYECRCPKCHGATKSYETNTYYKPYCSGKIGKIDIEEYSKKYKDKESKIRYMLDTTGIGSGTLWNEDNLFTSLDEASTFCEEYVPNEDGKPIRKVI